MLWFSLGKWTHAAGRWFTKKRYFKHGYKWTPLVKVQFRYLKTLT